MNKDAVRLFKNPQANNLDLRSQEGISCSNLISLIQDADEQYQRIIWEYKKGLNLLLT